MADPMNSLLYCFNFSLILHSINNICDNNTFSLFLFFKRTKFTYRRLYKTITGKSLKEEIKPSTCSTTHSLDASFHPKCQS